VDFLAGGPALEGVAAEALDGHFLVLGMNSLFHWCSPPEQGLVSLGKVVTNGYV
jgi:hypothetical protein